MVVHSILRCFVCDEFFPLTLDLVSDADIGCPRFWCRECTSPHRLTRRLKACIARMKAADIPLDGEIALALRMLDTHTSAEEAA